MATRGRKALRYGPPLVALLLPVLGGVASEGACGGQPLHGAGEAGGDAGLPSDAATDSITRPDAADAADAAEAGGQDCPLVPAGDVPRVPAGWVHAPCAAPSCDIFFAPDLAHTNPASAWASCGSGCLKMVTDWSANTSVWFGALGAAKDGVRWITYERDLGPPYSSYGSDPLEVQVVRLPDNVVTLDAIMTDGLGGACSQIVQAFSNDALLIELYSLPSANASTQTRLVYASPPSQTLPSLSFTHRDTLFMQTAAVSSQLWAASYAYFLTLEWHAEARADQMNSLWMSTNGAQVQQGGVVASGSTLFYALQAWGQSYGVLAWDSIGGSRPLVTFPSIAQGGASGPQTDGEQLVWLQASGWRPPDAGSYDTFDQVWLYTSPFATTASALAPRAVRRTANDSLLASGYVIGGGYVFGSEIVVETKTIVWTLTRLSDGASWTLSPPAGFPSIGQALYVDAEELAYVAIGPNNLNNTIVRQTLAALGPPLLADAGP
jgi:hypothetical protein